MEPEKCDELTSQEMKHSEPDPVKDFWWDFFGRKEKLQAEIAEYENTPARDIGQWADKKATLDAMKAELAGMEEQAREGRGDSIPGAPSATDLSEAGEREPVHIPSDIEAHGEDRNESDEQAIPGAMPEILTPEAKRDFTCTGKRQDAMSIELDEVCKGMPDFERGKSAAVMTKLKARAGKNGSCIVDTAADGNGVVWERIKGKQETLNADALDKRLRRRQGR
jgi:hypothetical protein